MRKRTISFQADAEDLQSLERLRDRLQSRKVGAWLTQSNLLREAIRLATEALEAKQGAMPSEA